MQISETGQITIPPHLRKQFGLDAHTEVELIVHGDHLLLRRKTQALQKQIDALYGSKKLDRSTDELMRLLRDE